MTRQAALVDAALNQPLPRTTCMGRAIGFAVVIVTLGVLLPRVLHALEAFLLAFLDKATLFMGTIQVPR